jgi:hypothetical protein
MFNSINVLRVVVGVALRGHAFVDFLCKTKLRSLLILLIVFTVAPTVSAQALDISSGGQPTITGALNGSVTGSASVLNDLVVTINFGEVSPANTNGIVKVTVPVALRSNQPYQVTVSSSGLINGNAQALQQSDVGFGIQNIRRLGGAGQICTQSTHVIPSPFDNDPETTATIGANGRVSYTSSLNNLSGSTLILSGPELSKNNSSKRQQSDGYIFDAIFTITPQFFAPGVSSVTLIFSISPGPNVPC